MIHTHKSAKIEAVMLEMKNRVKEGCKVQENENEEILEKKAMPRSEWRRDGKQYRLRRVKRLLKTMTRVKTESKEMRKENIWVS